MLSVYLINLITTWALVFFPIILWFTGLSGAGKTTISDLCAVQLEAMGTSPYVLDGDHLRRGINSDLGFSVADRKENMRRVTELAALFADAGHVVLVSLISPYRDDRDAARKRLAPRRFVEIHVDTPLEECERRDPKGLYARARSGFASNVTGIDHPYEPPLEPELRLTTTRQKPEMLADQVIVYLVTNTIVRSSFRDA